MKIIIIIFSIKNEKLGIESLSSTSLSEMSAFVPNYGAVENQDKDYFHFRSKLISECYKKHNQTKTNEIINVMKTSECDRKEIFINSDSGTKLVEADKINLKNTNLKPVQFKATRCNLPQQNLSNQFKQTISSTSTVQKLDNEKSSQLPPLCKNLSSNKKFHTKELTNVTNLSNSAKEEITSADKVTATKQKQQQSSPRKSRPRGFYRCDRPKQEEEEKKEGKKCQKVKPQI